MEKKWKNTKKVHGSLKIKKHCLIHEFRIILTYTLNQMIPYNSDVLYCSYQCLLNSLFFSFTVRTWLNGLYVENCGEQMKGQQVKESETQIIFPEGFFCSTLLNSGCFEMWWCDEACNGMPGAPTKHVKLHKHFHLVLLRVLHLMLCLVEVRVTSTVSTRCSEITLQHWKGWNWQVGIQKHTSEPWARDYIYIDVRFVFPMHPVAATFFWVALSSMDI